MKKTSLPQPGPNYRSFIVIISAPNEKAGMNFESAKQPCGHTINAGVGQVSLDSPNDR